MVLVVSWVTENCCWLTWNVVQPNDVTPFVFDVSADAFFRAAISLVAEVPRTIGKITDSEQQTIYLERARSRNVLNEKVTMNQTNKENYR